MGRGGGFDRSPAENWRPLGEIFVTRGFISEEELDDALKRQPKTGERLGEALVGLGVISKFELAGALAEQMASLGENDDDEASDEQQANVVQLPARSEEENDVPYGSTETEEPVAVEEEPEPEAEAVEIELVADAWPEPAADSEPFVLEEPIDFEPELVDVEHEVEEPVAEPEPVAEAALEPEPAP